MLLSSLCDIVFLSAVTNLGCHLDRIWNQLKTSYWAHLWRIFFMQLFEVRWPTLNMGITFPWKLRFLPLCLYILMVSSSTLLLLLHFFLLMSKAAPLAIQCEEKTGHDSPVIFWTVSGWYCWRVQCHGLRSFHVLSLSGVKMATVWPHWWP